MGTITAARTLAINGVGSANRYHVTYDNGGDYWVVYNLDRPSEVLYNADRVTDCILWAVAYINSNGDRMLAGEMADDFLEIASDA